MTSAAKKDNEDEDKVFADELAPGTQLLNGAYVIDRFLNSGGFGITYLAKDSLDRSVVIKECFPGSFCRRSNTIVGARSRAHQNEFRSIVKLFVQEARSLSKLKHPNIVGVHQVFEDNDTAYMALDYIEGSDLLDILEDPKRELGASQIQYIMTKLLDAVAFIHDQGVLHRDISPDNILIDAQDNPVLIDFGAAREEATKASRVLSALRVVKDGYSPQEFYIQGSDQAPSSDLYALGASFYHLITGDTPPNSQNRLAAIAAGDKDPYKALAERIEGYEPGFLEAIDKALNVFPKDRVQSAGAWLKLIEANSKSSTAAVAAETGEIEKTVVELVNNNNDIEAKQPGEPEAPAAELSPLIPQHEEAAVELETESYPEHEIDLDEPAPVVPLAAAAQAEVAAPPTPQPAERESRGKLGLLLGSAAAIAIVAAIAATQLGSGDDTDIATSAPVDGAVEVPQAVEPSAAVDAEPDVAAPVEAFEAETTVVETGAPSDGFVPPAVEEFAGEPASNPVAAEAPTDQTAAASPENPVEPVSAPIERPSLIETQSAADVADVAAALADAAESAESVAAGSVERPTAAEDVVVETVETAALDTPNAGIEPADIEAATENGTPPEFLSDVIRPNARPDNGELLELATSSDADITSPEVSQLNDAPKIEEVSANIDTEAAVPTPVPVFVEEPSVLELSAVMSGWSAAVPFGGDASGRTVETVDPSVESWLQPGQEIVRVNGLRISSIDQVEKVIRATTDLTDQSQVEAEIAYRQEEGGPILEQSIELEVLREIALLNGTRFQIVRGPDAWQTIVVDAAGQSEGGLQLGDQLVSYILTDTLMDGPTSLRDLFETELGAGQTSFNFAVLRDGTTWLATMEYEAEIEN